MADGVAEAQEGHVVLFENERVRIWEIRLEPGETLPMHRHMLDYVAVSLSGGPTRIHLEDGRVLDRDHQPGNFTFQHAPHVHSITNTGPNVYLNRIIELKR
jgi:quercetin dioxygenase-like cupin family protein